MPGRHGIRREPGGLRQLCDAPVTVVRRSDDASGSLNQVTSNPRQPEGTGTVFGTLTITAMSPRAL
jgi:hypothetical protein